MSPPLEPSVEERLREIGAADVLVGIPSYNNARTIGHVVRAAAAGLAKYFPDQRAVIVNSDGGSTDSYRVRLELTGGAVTEDIGEVHYEMQGSRCQGDLTLWAVDAVSEALSLGEYIESGNCVKGGRITLTPMPDGTLDFAYTGAKVDGSEQTVRSALEKVR